MESDEAVAKRILGDGDPERQKRRMVNPNVPRQGRISRFRYPSWKLKPAPQRRCTNRREYHSGMNGWRVGPEGAGTLCQLCHNKWLRAQLDYVSAETDLTFKEGETVVPIDDPDEPGVRKSELVVCSALRYRKGYGGRTDGPSFPGDKGHRGAMIGGKKNRAVLDADEDDIEWEPVPWAGPPADYLVDTLVEQTEANRMAMMTVYNSEYTPTTHTIASKRRRVSPCYTFHGTLYTPTAFTYLQDPQRPRIPFDRIYECEYDKTVVNRPMPVLLMRNVEKAKQYIVATSLAELERRAARPQLSGTAGHTPDEADMMYVFSDDDL